MEEEIVEIPCIGKFRKVTDDSEICHKNCCFRYITDDERTECSAPVQCSGCNLGFHWIKEQ